MQIVDELFVTRQTLGDIYLQRDRAVVGGLGDSWCRGDTSTGEEKLATQIVLDQMERLRALFIAPGAAIALSRDGCLRRGGAPLHRRSHDGGSLR